jgi:hypothetical protein
VWSAVGAAVSFMSLSVASPVHNVSVCMRKRHRVCALVITGACVCVCAGSTRRQAGPR